MHMSWTTCHLSLRISPGFESEEQRKIQREKENEIKNLAFLRKDSVSTPRAPYD